MHRRKEMEELLTAKFFFKLTVDSGTTQKAKNNNLEKHFAVSLLSLTGSLNILKLQFD